MNCLRKKKASNFEERQGSRNDEEMLVWVCCGYCDMVERDWNG